MLSRKRNNFGRWINFKLHTMEKTKSWLERKAKLSDGCIQRWTSGSTPHMDNYFKVCTAIAKATNVHVVDIVKDTLEYMPYLVSFQMEPKNCPTCGQSLHLQKNPQPRQ